MKILQSDYFSYLPIDACNCPFNFIETLRDRGKTFTAKLRTIKRYQKTGHGAIWVRRTIEDTRKTKASFIKGKKGEKLASMCGASLDDFRLVGDFLEMRRRGKWGRVVEFCTLSQASRDRSADDSAFDRMYLDEGFVSARKRAMYPGNEVNDLFDLYFSKRRDDSRLVLYVLGNKESAYNPYLAYFGIPQIPAGWSGIRTYRDNTVAVQVDLTPPKHGSNFGNKVARAMDGTAYGDFLYKGVARSFGAVSIAPKPRGAIYYASFDFVEPVTAWRHGRAIYFTKGVDAYRCVFVPALTTKYKRAIVYGNRDRERMKLLIQAKRENAVHFSDNAVGEIASQTLEQMRI